MPLSERNETAATGTHAVSMRRPGEWRDIFPAHRLPVLVKTPIIVALGAYFAHADFQRAELTGALILATLLWAALYALNEMTDVTEEQDYYVSQTIQSVLYTLPILVCVASWFFSKALFLCLTAMTFGQYAYCVPAIRLKKYWLTIVLLSGALNPLLRMQCGAIWGTQRIPLLAGTVFVLLHLGATFRARTLQRDRDKRLAYHVAPRFSDWFGPVCTASGLVGAVVLCLQGILPRFFILYILIAGGFSAYAWSGRVHSMKTLRRGWIGFALLALVALLLLAAAR